MVDRTLDFFAASKEPGSDVARAIEIDEDFNEPIAPPQPGRNLMASFMGLWHDPLFVRLPFEERRLGLTLAALLAITLYVAFLSIAVNTVFAHAAAGMGQDTGKRVTFEVLADPTHPEDVREKQSRASAVVQKLQEIPGVISVTRVGDDKMAELLEPWLGKSAPPPDLPLPALIDVQLDPAKSPTKEDLNKAVDGIPNIMLDDHARWETALSRSARALEFTAFCVLLLGFVALALTAAFAAETHFYINRDTIEILHFIGARDSAIARHMGMAVLRFAAVAASAAFAVGVVTLIVLWASMRGLDLSFFPNFALPPAALFGVIAKWVLTSLLAVGLCFAAAYFTVLRALLRLI
jgi:cell division transport system permease protein